MGRGKAWKGGEADPDGRNGREEEVGEIIGGPSFDKHEQRLLGCIVDYISPIFLSVDLE